MTRQVSVVAGLSALVAATAGFALVSHRRRKGYLSRYSQHNLAEEERRSTDLLRALDANTTEAGINGGHLEAR